MLCNSPEMPYIRHELTPKASRPGICRIFKAAARQYITSRKFFLETLLLDAFLLEAVYRKIRSFTAIHWKRTEMYE